MLGFTQPHSSQQPVGARSDVVAYEKGAFAFADKFGWIACPSNQAKAVNALYQIYAKIPTVNFENDCIEVIILAVDWKGASPAAWEYI